MNPQDTHINEHSQSDFFISQKECFNKAQKGSHFYAKFADDDGGGWQT